MCTIGDAEHDEDALLMIEYPSPLDGDCRACCYQGRRSGFSHMLHVGNTTRAPRALISKASERLGLESVRLIICYGVSSLSIPNALALSKSIRQCLRSNMV